MIGRVFDMRNSSVKERNPTKNSEARIAVANWIPQSSGRVGANCSFAVALPAIFL